MSCRGVSGGWAGWAIAHPVLGRIEGAARRRRGGSGTQHYYLPTQFEVATYAPELSTVQNICLCLQILPIDLRHSFDMLWHPQNSKKQTCNDK